MNSATAPLAVLLISALVITACAPTRQRPPVDAAANAQRVRALDQWQITGKIAVRRADHGHSGLLDWRQDHDHFRIRVSGPLGTGGFSVAGGPGRVTLDYDGRKRSAASPEALLEKALGWRIPVSPLVYWVRGLPAPAPRRHTINYDRGLPTLLRQSGWRIEYADFTTVGAVVLPDKLVLTRGDVRIVVVIKRWQLGATALAVTRPPPSWHS